MIVKPIRHINGILYKLIFYTADDEGKIEEFEVRNLLDALFNRLNEITDKKEHKKYS